MTELRVGMQWSDETEAVSVHNGRTRATLHDLDGSDRRCQLSFDGEGDGIHRGPISSPAREKPEKCNGQILQGLTRGGEQTNEGAVALQVQRILPCGFRQSPDDVCWEREGRERGLILELKYLHEQS